MMSECFFALLLFRKANNSYIPRNADTSIDFLVQMLQIERQCQFEFDAEENLQCLRYQTSIHCGTISRFIKMLLILFVVSSLISNLC